MINVKAVHSDFITAIKGALNTEEDGMALIEVARNAHNTELKLSKVYRIAQENAYSQILSQLIMEAIEE